MPFINGIGAPELIIILIIALIVVGPGRLPDVGSALGKSIREFRKAATDVKDATSLEEPQPAPVPRRRARRRRPARPAVRRRPSGRRRPTRRRRGRPAPVRVRPATAAAPTSRSCPSRCTPRTSSRRRRPRRPAPRAPWPTPTPSGTPAFRSPARPSPTPAPPPAAPGPASTEMTLVDHLAELRDRLVKVLIVVILTSLVGFYFATPIIGILVAPLPNNQLQFTGLGDAFFINVKIAIVVGIILAMPVILYQVWAFIAPGLTDAERRTVRPWIPIALVFFALGVGIAYVILPYAVQFLLGFSSQYLNPLITAGPYFDFVTTLFLAFGLIMEFPILLFGLSRVGIVTSERLSSRAPDGDPRDRDLRGGRDPGRRPRQPVRAGHDDVPPVRGHDLRHPAQREVAAGASERRHPACTPL